MTTILRKWCYCMTESKPVVKVGKNQQRILLIRGEKVIVDAEIVVNSE